MQQLLISQYVGAAIAHKSHSNMVKSNEDYRIIALAAGLLDLIEMQYVTLTEKENLKINTQTPPTEPHLAILYTELQNTKEKTLKKWIEKFVAGFSQKVWKEYLQALDTYLLDSGIIQIHGEKGVLIKSDNYQPTETVIAALEGMIQKATENIASLNPAENATLACLCTVHLVAFLSDRADEKEIRKQIKNNPEYKAITYVMDEMTAIITTIILS